VITSEVSLDVRPNVTATYTLTAKNNYNKSAQKSVIVTVSEKPPVITSFFSAPNPINKGESSELQWQVTGADKIVITSDKDALFSVDVSNDVDSKLIVTPSETSVYTLAASYKGVSATPVTTTLVVNDTPPPPPPPPVPVPTIQSFAAISPIYLGESSRLTWSVSDAKSISISANGESIYSSNDTSVVELIVTPTVDTTYILTATNDGGSVTSSVAVGVLSSRSDNPVIVEFIATPATVDSGGETTLSWKVTGATKITIYSDSGNGASKDDSFVTSDVTPTVIIHGDTITGSLKFMPETSLTDIKYLYRIQVENSVGSDTKKVIVVVNGSLL
jgi:hypothetical protein